MSERGEDQNGETLNKGQLPAKIDTTKPSIARVYDWFLGGKDNFAIDRQVAEAALKIAPGAQQAGLQNRAFLRRVVHHMAAEAGVRQFIDIGSGLPTQGNVHQVAQEVDPAARVVYVDNDPMVLVHGRALLTTDDSTTVIQADARDPRSILENDQVKKFIDFSEPVGLLMLSILHHLNDHEDPAGVAATLRAPLVSGSFVAISHFCNPGDVNPAASQQATTVEKVFNENLGTGRWRTMDEIMEYFGDFELLDPGLVPLPEWRDEPGFFIKSALLYHTYYGGLARKP
ncbi:SAM-dependent methyltransferase [Sphaerisporangium sp. TRM90804]|uniref:SAM-dependent methyltransferase n=1 Tax=Sphaerisporangium sp. TRM90804 TaxID=3031113 RepID=UPI00244B9E1A|nr:SAM-dependent methyltransferase [Sphaerisporangium sp. TRM90804]MDH2426922.1 SAM-dependent methyltransferase [Sphaerisporangium sp. TRM90804]